MFAPIWQGWPLAEKQHGQRRRRKASQREHTAMYGLGSGVYVAISPCGRVAKVGFSWNPIIRVHEGTGWRPIEKRLGIGRVQLVRVYDGDDADFALEKECHRFLAPEAIPNANEWFRVGPRLRILIARLDRRFGGVDLRDDFAAALHHQRTSQAA